MNEDTSKKAQRQGRAVEVFVTGDDAAELEQAAMDKAREFFGADLPLAPAPAYKAFSSATSSLPVVVASGKRYYASAVVRVAEPDGGTP